MKAVRTLSQNCLLLALLTIAPHAQPMRCTSKAVDSETISLSAIKEAFIQSTITTLVGHDDDVNTICFDPSGRKIASGSDDCSIEIWDLKNRSSIMLKGHTESVNSIQFSHDGNTVVSGSRDKTIRLWDLAQGSSRTLTGHTKNVYSVCFMAQNNYSLLSESTDGTFGFWQLNQNTQMITSQPYHIDQPDLNCTITKYCNTQGNFFKVFDYNKDGAIDVARNSDNAFVTLNLNSDTIDQYYFSPDGESFAVTEKDGTITIFNFTDQSRIALKEHTMELEAACFSPDCKFFVSASYDGTLKVWDLVNQTCTYELEMHGIVNAICISPDTSNGMIIACAFGSSEITGEEDNVVRIWNITQHKEIKNFFDKKLENDHEVLLRCIVENSLVGDILDFDDPEHPGHIVHEYAFSTLPNSLQNLLIEKQLVKNYKQSVLF